MVLRAHAKSFGNAFENKVSGKKHSIALVAVSATRLGEFSPIGQLFTLGSFLNMTKVAKVLGQLFSTLKVIF
jgi:hypothetical protein